MKRLIAPEIESRRPLEGEASPDDLRPEYDLRQLLPGGVRGKYAERYRVGTNMVDPDVAEALPDEEAENQGDP